MEESLCNIEISKSANSYTAKIQTDLGGVREFRSSTFEDILRRIALDLQEEFEIVLWLNHFLTLI